MTTLGWQVALLRSLPSPCVYPLTETHERDTTTKEINLWENSVKPRHLLYFAPSMTTEKTFNSMLKKKQDFNRSDRLFYFYTVRGEAHQSILCLRPAPPLSFLLIGHLLETEGLNSRDQSLWHRTHPRVKKKVLNLRFYLIGLLAHTPTSWNETLSLLVRWIC